MLRLSTMMGSFFGMGTEIQSKTYLPGYYSMKDLNDNVGNSLWGLYHEEKTLKNGQYHESFFPRPAIDGYLGYDKEQLRQTILKHESIFRHQLQELHRLYKRQRDLMNEIKRSEIHRHLISAEMSQSSLFLSHIPFKDAKKACHASNLPFMDSTSGGQSTLGTHNIQSSLSFMKGKNTSSPFPFQDGVFSKDCETLDSKCNMFQKSLFNLELSADYMNNEEKRLEGVSGVSGVESYPLDRKCEVTHNRNVNLILGSDLKSGCNGDASRCNLYLRSTCDMADLNEPIQVEETSISASVHNVGNITRREEDIQRRVSLNSNAGFCIFSKESAGSFLLGRDGGICIKNLCSENKRNQKEQSTCDFEAGQARCHTNSLHRVVSPEDLPTPFRSLQLEPRKAHEPMTFLLPDQSKTEPQRKRKIFGVEISKGGHDESAVSSHTPNMRLLVPQTDVANSKSSSGSPWRKQSNSLRQNVISVQENPCASSSDPSNKSSDTLMQNPEIIGGQMHINSSLRSISSSTVDGSYQTGPCLGSQSDTKQLLVCCSSVGYSPSGINGIISVTEKFVPPGPMKYSEVSECINVKPAKDIDTNKVPPSRFQEEVIPQQNPGSLDGKRKHENPKGGLPWLKANAFSSGEQTKEMECSYQVNLDSLKTYSEQFSNKTEIGKGPSQSLVQDSTSSMCAHGAEIKKIEVGECRSNSKILGFPIFDVPHTSKDLTSLSSPSKSNRLASDVNDEEEASTAPSLPRAIVKIATTEIDLEAPAVLECETDQSPETDSSNDQLKKPSKLLLDESKEPHEELVRVAAEAIIAISFSAVHNLLDDATHLPSEASSGNSLHWFAEVISSYKGGLEENVRAVSTGIDSTFHEEAIPDGMDYFEFMTLKLTETEIGDCYKPPALENQKDEETGATRLPKRPRKGQARRGRQRKDFQSDILPSLVSLSRHEVTKDLQTIEELFRASGCTWQSRLSQRNTAKKGRGRRRLGDSAPSLAASTVCAPPIQQPIYGELRLEEKSLTGIINNNLSLWNSILVGYFRAGHFDEVLRRYLDLRQRKIGVDSSAITFALKSCIELGSLDFGRGIHVDAFKYGLSADRFVGSSLIKLYSTCGNINNATIVLDEIIERDVVAYTSMITGYAQCGDHCAYEAFRVVRHMQEEELYPNRVTLVSLLQVAASLEALAEGRSVHCYAIRRGIGCSDEVFETSLMDMYIKCGETNKAASIFSKMSTRTVVSWNALIAGHLQMGHPLEALELFFLMLQENLDPDLVTLANGILSCADLGYLLQGKSIHGYMHRTGIQLDLVATTALIDMYSKCNNFIQAGKIFDRMGEKDVISFNVMMGGYLRNGLACKAMKTFHEMVQTVIRPNPSTILNILSALSDLKDVRQGRCIHGFVFRHGFELNADIANQIIFMYAKCGCIDFARQVFNGTKYKDLVSWTSMMMGYVYNGHADEAIAFFQLMQRDKVDPDPVTLIGLLQGFTQLGCLSSAKEVHGHIYRVSMEKEVPVVNSLITTYGKCGKLNMARNLFDHTTERCLTSWNTMIAAYGMHGKCGEAFELFDRMKKEKVAADEVTFTSVLSACSHSGLVEEGLHIFKSMKEEYSTVPCEEHYGCMVDLLSRAGRIEEAYDLLKCLPSRQSASALGALLAACRVHRNIEMGEVIGRQLLDLEPENPSTYGLVSNIYAEVGKWDEVARIRATAKARGLKRTPGYSLIELDKQISEM
ncbi:hypothetical protein F0562_005116 [Nyssa sinensis]|uniref:Pentatricopeptide repeat-containing protein n=1 Tax=Nyssa sinensis TaxID=561372 RepID=A0A5J5ALM5_9ASTE|nr:hypothetical protein F0562_005116 [Nyssa sinensis]